MITAGRSAAVPVAVASALLLAGACGRAGDERGAADPFPPFCSSAPSGAACATSDEVVSFWGGRPLLDTDVWNRTWVVEPGRGDRAGQGDSVVSVLYERDAPATFEKAFDLSFPVVQQTIVTDGSPDVPPFADRPEDLDGSDGLTKRWIEVGGRRMLHMATSEVDQLQFVEPLEDELGVYVEVTLASGQFETLRTVTESLEDVT